MRATGGETTPVAHKMSPTKKSVLVFSFSLQSVVPRNVRTNPTVTLIRTAALIRNRYTIIEDGRVDSGRIGFVAIAEPKRAEFRTGSRSVILVEEIIVGGAGGFSVRGPVLEIVIQSA